MQASELFQRIQSNRAPVIIDPRSEIEFKGGHIPGAINAPVRKILLHRANLPPDKNLEMVIACMHGQRAVAAKWLLALYGYRGAAASGSILTSDARLALGSGPAAISATQTYDFWGGRCLVRAGSPVLRGHQPVVDINTRLPDVPYGAVSTTLSGDDRTLAASTLLPGFATQGATDGTGIFTLAPVTDDDMWNIDVDVLDLIRDNAPPPVNAAAAAADTIFDLLLYAGLDMTRQDHWYLWDYGFENVTPPQAHAV